MQQDEAIREATASEPLTLEVASACCRQSAAKDAVWFASAGQPYALDAQEEHSMQRSWSEDDDSAPQLLCAPALLASGWLLQ